MTITEADLELYARRIRVHFEPPLRDIAEELALTVAQAAGPKTKLLRPESTLDEIFGWMPSLDTVEVVMSWKELVEDELSALFDPSASTTFRQLVQRVALCRRSRRHSLR